MITARAAKFVFALAITLLMTLPSPAQNTYFTPGNLVVAVEGCGVHGGACTNISNGTGNGTGNSTVGGYGDNQGAPLTLFQFSRTGRRAPRSSTRSSCPRVATFTWTDDNGTATGYWLDVGSSPGGNNYYQSGNLGTATTTTAYSLPADGSQIYVTLWSYVGGQWANNQYTYISGL